MKSNASSTNQNKHIPSYKEGPVTSPLQPRTSLRVAAPESTRNWFIQRSLLPLLSYVIRGIRPPDAKLSVGTHNTLIKQTNTNYRDFAYHSLVNKLTRVEQAVIASTDLQDRAIVACQEENIALKQLSLVQSTVHCCGIGQIVMLDLQQNGCGKRQEFCEPHTKVKQKRTIYAT